MRQIKLPNAPNPNDSAYAGNPIKYNNALYLWMNQMKGLIEQSSAVNSTPVNQAFTLGSYVMSTSMAGTSTGTDVNNFILTLVNAMMKKGILKQVSN